MTNLIHIVCTGCNAANRIPASRLADRPACGKCHEPLFTGHPVDLDEPAFDRQLQHSDIPVLVDFWADWCAPCRAMAPAYAQAASQLEPTVRVVKLDTERAQATSARFAIRSIPTLMLFRNGKEIARQAGGMSAADIVRWTRAHI